MAGNRRGSPGVDAIGGRVTRILFVNPNFEDYAADGVFHGLRTLFGADVVDFPKAEYMYDSMSAAAKSRIRGHGFTLYGRLPDIPVDRDHCLARALAGEFDLVFFGDIWRTFGLFTEWGPQLADRGVAMAVLDGSDRIEPYPFAGDWWRRRAWWFVPRAHTRAAYFKREISPWTRWFATYLAVPPPLNRFRMREIHPLSFSIPAANIVVGDGPEKVRDFATHVVDPDVAQRLGQPTRYAFDDEQAYINDLRGARFGITMKREGWDCLRHYEIAAAGCVPCFRDLTEKFEQCAPFGLEPGTNCLSYRDPDDLFRQIESLTAATYARLRASAIAWAHANTTEQRARGILQLVGLRH